MNGPFDWRTFHSVQLSFNRRYRNGVSFGLNDTIVLYDHQSTRPRYDHRSDGSFVQRADQAESDDLLGTFILNKQVIKGNFLWDLPDVGSGSGGHGVLAAIANDWQLSGVFTGQTGTAYDVGFTYQSGGGNINLTGSPDYPARVRVVGDPGNGCTDDLSRQFNTAAFQGPLVGSVGLDSRINMLRGCFEKNIDLSVMRNIGIGGTRTLQFRVDFFNAFNFGGIVGTATNPGGRNTTLALTNPNDPVTATNLPYDAAGNPIASRLTPAGAGFGVANNYQLPRRVQAYVRLSF